jgi:hypothetical protein
LKVCSVRWQRLAGQQQAKRDWLQATRECLIGQLYPAEQYLAQHQASTQLHAARLTELRAWQAHLEADNQAIPLDHMQARMDTGFASGEHLDRISISPFSCPLEILAPGTSFTANGLIVASAWREPCNVSPLIPANCPANPIRVMLIKVLAVRASVRLGRDRHADPR